jgi:uncharacterized protein with PQ loop repeat
MLETLAWIGSIAFIISAFPQVWTTHKDGHARGLNWLFIALWFLGGLCMALYGLGTGATPLALNYTLQTVLVSVIIYYKKKGG